MKKFVKVGGASFLAIAIMIFGVYQVSAGDQEPVETPKQHLQVLKDVAPADLNSMLDQHELTNEMQALYFDDFITPFADNYRTVNVSGNFQGKVVVKGQNFRGEPIQEVVFVNNNTVETSIPFMVVSPLWVPAGQPGQSISIGYGDTFGFQELTGNNDGYLIKLDRIAENQDGSQALFLDNFANVDFANETFDIDSNILDGVTDYHAHYYIAR